jgi:hypothetical protein
VRRLGSTTTATGIVAALAMALGGCGSSSSSSPLGTGLTYFPKDSPFVMSVVTDPGSPAVKNGQAMLHRLPLATFGEAAYIARLQQLGINYDADIRPLFGNPLLVGIEGPGATGATRSKVLIVWVTKDAGTLNSLIKKLHLPRTQSHGGATLYQVSNFTLATSGATLVAGPQASVFRALDRHAHGQGMSSADYNREIGNLPQDSLIEAFGYLNPLLSAKGGSARNVPWVAALRGYGVAISASSSGLSFRYTLDTGGAALSSAQLPLAPGSSPPGLAGSLPIQVGLRDPATTLRFVLDAQRRSSPAKYAADLARMNAVRRKTGVDFNRDVLGQLGGNAAVDSDGHALMVRVDVRDPAAAARTLRRLGTSALDIGGTHSNATSVTLGPGSFETAHRANGKTVLFGLVGSEFVAGTATPSQLRAFAAAPAAAAPGAQGAAAFRVALPQLLALALRSSPSKTLQQVLSSLGDVTGWLSASPSALTGNATLALK